jgi:hypothetical protein
MTHAIHSTSISPNLIHHRSFVRYCDRIHPECPDRITRILKEFQAEGILEHERLVQVPPRSVLVGGPPYHTQASSSLSLRPHLDPGIVLASYWVVVRARSWLVFESAEWTDVVRVTCPQ